MRKVPFREVAEKLEYAGNSRQFYADMINAEAREQTANKLREQFGMEMKVNTNGTVTFTQRELQQVAIVADRIVQGDQLLQSQLTPNVTGALTHEQVTRYRAGSGVLLKRTLNDLKASGNCVSIGVGAVVVGITCYAFYLFHTLVTFALNAITHVGVFAKDTVNNVGSFIKNSSNNVGNFIKDSTDNVALFVAEAMYNIIQQSLVSTADRLAGLEATRSILEKGMDKQLADELFVDIARNELGIYKPHQEQMSPWIKDPRFIAGGACVTLAFAAVCYATYRYYKVVNGRSNHNHGNNDNGNNGQHPTHPPHGPINVAPEVAEIFT